MKQSPRENTIGETDEKARDNCTPIEGSQWVSRECLERNKSISEVELSRDCGEYCYEDFGM